MATLLQRNDPNLFPTLESAGPAVVKNKTRLKRIIAIGGGKGGIGKSMVSTNLAVALAQGKQKVILVDVDLGGANLHTCLGISPPRNNLAGFLSRKYDRLEEVLAPTGIENLSLIAGSHDEIDAANLKYQQKQKFLRHLKALDVDFVVLDLGAGTSFNMLDFFAIADHGVLVLLPEPTSVENAYRFAKSAFFRKLYTTQESLGICEQIDQASMENSLQSPYDFVERIRRKDPEIGAILEAELKAFRIRLIVNQARSALDREVGTAVVSAWQKFFGLGMDFLGAIEYDDCAWKAVRKRKPLLVDQPQSEAAKGILSVARQLMVLDGQGVELP